MSELDLVAYLASKGYQGRQANGPEVAYPCFFDCGEDPHSRKRKLYVNTDDGYYVCFVCGAQGGTYLLQKHFGDTPDEPLPGGDPHTRRKILNWAADTGSAMLTNNDRVLIYLLDERGLSYQTVVERRLGCIVPPWSLTGSLPEQFTRDELTGTGLVWNEGVRAGQDYFYDHLLIPYVERGNVVGMRGRSLTDRGAKYLSGQGDHNRLFNLDSLDGADDVILTEGELDAVVLHQHLRAAADDRARRIAVIGLSGVNGFPEGAERYFANVKRIYIGFDPDDPGQRAAVALKEKLGTRARILELPPELPKCDWSEYLLPIQPDATDEWRGKHPHAGHTWRDVMGLLGNAAGKRLFNISEVGFAYRQAKLENPFGIKTGFAQLDGAIEPGLLPGQVMIVLAKTGTGKTLFLCNVAWNARHQRILFLSLEMTKEEVYERLMRIALFHNPRWTDADVEDALSNIIICDLNRLSEKDIDSLIDEYKIESGDRPTLCLIDYLGYFARGVKGPSSYEKVSNAVMALKAIAKAGRVSIIVPSQVNRSTNEGKPIDLDGGRDSGVVEETADVVVSLYRPDDALSRNESRPNVYPNAQVFGTILKSRHGGVDTQIKLQMDLLTLALVDMGTTECSRAKAHNTDHLEEGLTYPELRAKEMAPIQPDLYDTR